MTSATPLLPDACAAEEVDALAETLTPILECKQLAALDGLLSAEPLGAFIDSLPDPQTAG